MADILIIGGGLAGVLTALNLYRKNESITIEIIDNNFPHAAWKIAAGIINPVSGKRIVKTANIEEILSTLHELNSFVYEKTNTSFFKTKPILRIFRDENELQYWNKKTAREEEYGSWLENTPTPKRIIAPYGCGIINKGGYLDIKGLLSAIRTMISDRVLFTNVPYVSNQFQKYRNSYDTIIMCYGWEMMSDPLWRFLPFAPFKGEVLTVKMPDSISEQYILNNGTYFLPLGNGTARIGATIEHDELHYKTTEKAKSTLLDDFYAMTGIIPETLAHDTGIRPGIEDRYPVIGKHPEINNLYILNGLGGRGALYSPHCASILSDFFTMGREIPRLYTVDRYYHLYQ